MEINELLDSGANPLAGDERVPCALLEVAFRSSGLFIAMLDKVESSILPSIKDEYGNNLWDIAAILCRKNNMEALLAKGFPRVVTDKLINAVIKAFASGKSSKMGTFNFLNFSEDEVKRFLDVFEYLLSTPGFQPSSSNLIKLIKYFGPIGKVSQLLKNSLNILLNRLTPESISEALNFLQIKDLPLHYDENHIKKDVFKECILQIEIAYYWKRYQNSSLLNCLLLSLANQDEATIKNNLSNVLPFLKECMLRSPIFLDPLIEQDQIPEVKPMASDMLLGHPIL